MLRFLLRRDRVVVATLMSPFHFLPRVLTGEQLTAAPLVGLAAVAALLTSVGVARLRVRDLGQEAPEIRQNRPVEA